MRIFDKDYWREIISTLSRNKTRTFLTGFGIFWGTAMLALLIGGADGLTGIISRNFDGFATNMVGMFADRTTVSYRGFNKGTEWNMKMRDVEQIKRHVPYIDASTPQFFLSGTLTYKDKSRLTSIMGAEPDIFKINLPVIYEGRLFNEQDNSQGDKVAVIGHDIATEFFGNDSAVGKYVNAGGVYVRIIGVIGQKGEVSLGGRLDESILLPANTARRAYALGDDVHFFMFTIEEGHGLEEIKPDILRILRSNHPISPEDDAAVVMFDVSEMFKRVEGVFLAVSLLAMFVGGGTLVAGVIGVGNIMWIIVKERTQEIGIRRALGAHPSAIVAQVLAEGSLLTLVSGVAGISFATIILAVVDNAFTTPLNGAPGFGLTLGTALWIMGVFIVLGSLAGLIPALKAMKIKPIEALNDK